MTAAFWTDPFYSYLFLGGYLGLMTVLWALVAFGVSRWGKPWRLNPDSDAVLKADASDWLSICIPARNEEKNIEACLKAALATQWPKMEVILVDDRSTDQTGAIAKRLATLDPRLTVVDGTEPQVGWAGKPWACSRAAGEARGKWLLFIDADVQIHPLAAAVSIKTAKERDLSLLSIFGKWTLIGFWERTLIPAIGWLIRGSIELDKVNKRAAPEAFANGQYILMRRDSYVAIGGHGAVRDEVLEDVRLAQVVKKTGLGVEVRPAPWAFDVRLYRSLKEIIDGYTKNIYEGLGRNPIMGFGVAFFIFIGSLFPFIALGGCLYAKVFLGWGFPGTPWLFWIGFVCLLQILFRWQVEKYDDRPGTQALLHPLANCLLLYIVLRSTLNVRVKWKGRTFVDGKASS